MSRIDIRGVIVPSAYDSEWTKQYIAKGIITPESVVRSAINGANKTGPLELYINSPGGSVFAAYEIINALADWKAANKQPVNITVGAMAASAASAIAILSGANLALHRNSKLMFHGAWTETVGGSEAHEDTATLLEQINADIKTKLVSQYGIEPEKVEEWFAEGRMGWLTAADAMKYGMASAIVDADDDEIDFAGDDVVDIEEHGLKIAALLPQAAPPAPPVPEEKPADAPATPAEPVATEPAAEPVVEPAPDAVAAEDAAEREAAYRARAEAEFSDRAAEHVRDMAELTAKLDKTETARAAEQSAKDKALAEIARLKKDFEEQRAVMTEALERANARIVKWLNGSLSFSPTIETWAEALKACDGDYATARKQYPDAYATFMQTQTKRK